jgi:serine/threonine-protein kinase
MGTPLYMSPEQVEGKPLDARSDIYSLGVTSYEMLAGEPPFRGETALSIAVQHLHTQPPRLENLRADLPAAVCRIVHKMLEKDPGERYATGRQLLSDLRAVSIELFQDDPGEAADGWQDDLVSVVEARRAATERLAVAMRTTAMPAVRRGRRWWGWALIALACMLAGTGASWVLRPRPLIVPVAEDPTAIARHETAAQQLIYATLLDSEAGWKSVGYYFPDDKLNTNRATQGLALWYLREFDYARAKEIFDQFANYNPAEVEFRAFGLAGQAVVLIHEGRFNEAAEKLTILWPQRDQLDGEMRALVGLVLSGRRLPGDDRSSFGRARAKWRPWAVTAPPAKSADESDSPPAG